MNRKYIPEEMPIDIFDSIADKGQATHNGLVYSGNRGLFFNF